MEPIEDFKDQDFLSSFARSFSEDNTTNDSINKIEFDFDLQELSSTFNCKSKESQSVFLNDGDVNKRSITRKKYQVTDNQSDDLNLFYLISFLISVTSICLNH